MTVSDKDAVGVEECPGRESNPHLHCCKQDFKSCVSTSSTTRAVSEKKSRQSGKQRAEDRARTGHPDLGKVVLYQMSYFRNNYKNCFRFSDGKNKGCIATTKIFYLYFGLYRVFSGTFTSGFPLYQCVYKLKQPPKTKANTRKTWQNHINREDDTQLCVKSLWELSIISCSMF